MREGRLGSINVRCVGVRARNGWEMELRVAFCNFPTEEVKALEDDDQLGPLADNRGGQSAFERKVEGYATLTGLAELRGSFSNLP